MHRSCCNIVSMKFKCTDLCATDRITGGADQNKSIAAISPQFADTREVELVKS